MDYHLTTATFRDKREPPPWHVWHLIRPRDSHVTQGSFPLPLHFRHLQKKDVFSKSITIVRHLKDLHLSPKTVPAETMNAE